MAAEADTAAAGGGERPGPKAAAKHVTIDVGEADHHEGGPPASAAAPSPASATSSFAPFSSKRSHATAAAMEDPEAQPFVNRSPPLGFGGYLRAIVVLIVLGPFRLVIFCVAIVLAWLFSTLATLGWQLDAPEPLPPWRLAVLAPVPFLWRTWLFSMGYWHIKVRGTPAPRAAAPICVCNHQSFLDIFIMYAMARSQFVAKKEVGKIPLGSSIIIAGQTLVVDRTSRKSSHLVLEKIRERANSALPWPPIIIFPEGTCTNGTAMIAFKRGAFTAGVPVQPIVIRYTWGTVDPCKVYGGGPGIMAIIGRLFTAVDSGAEVTFLDPVAPEGEELDDPYPFAERVRVAMAAELGVPCTEHSFADVQLLLGARKVFKSGGYQRKMAKGAAKHLELRALEELMGKKIDVKEATEYLKMFTQAQADGHSGSFVAQLSGRHSRSQSISELEEREPELSFVQFCKALNLPADPLTERIFQLFDSDESGSINIREFIASLAWLSNGGDLDTAVDAALVAVDKDKDGIITREEFLGGINLPDQMLRRGSMTRTLKMGGTNLPPQMNAKTFKKILTDNPAYLALMWGQEADGSPRGLSQSAEGLSGVDEEEGGGDGGGDGGEIEMTERAGSAAGSGRAGKKKSRFFGRGGGD